MFTLLIEDTIALAQTVTRYLANEGISCTLRTDGLEGYMEAVNHTYDVIILDIELPNMNGIEVCRKLRREGITTPIIMLTSRSTQEDIISGLDYGADDYISKPCDYRELVARIRALKRRDFAHKGTETIEIGPLKIEEQHHKVYFHDNVIKLSKREYELLLYLVRNSTRTIEKRELSEKIWGNHDMFSDQKVIEVYIGYLRKKIPQCIETRKGFGYSLNISWIYAK